MDDALTEAIKPEAPVPAEEPKKRPAYEYQSPAWDGRYRRVVEIVPKLPAFREWYMRHRFDPTGKKVSIVKLVDSFNEAMPEGDRDFWPYQKVLATHGKRWDETILEQQKAARAIALHRSEIEKQLGVSHEQASRVEIEIIPTEESTDKKTRTLGDMLLDDAMDVMSQDVEQLGPETDGEMMLKRKKYALNVYGMVVKTVQRDKELKLKMKADDRENAGFMLNLINSAIAGKLTPEMLASMHVSVDPKMPVESVQTQEAHG